MNEYEFTGKTVEDAVEEGLRALGLAREEAEIVVLEEGKKGLFKSVKAKVKISKRKTDGERAVDFLEGLFDILGIAATNELEESEENTKINVITTNSYSVIGHRGEILDALQVLAGAVANIGREEYKRVVVDCENYREKREETLKRLANKLAEKAVRTGRKLSLEPMSPYERRVIHSALADSTEVKTQSEGKEPNRYIVVIPNNMRPGSDRFERRGGKGGYGKDRKNFGDRGDRRGGYNKDRQGGKPYDRRERRDRNPSSGGARPAKRAPYFGTYLGNSNAARTEDEGKNEE
ncbi:MAG TPA: protein jag [Candidatus Borkfalkia avistercoris]|uniref:RNA-binding protein KhpB n=1 Tax=Candidatus Borkfalkia avistercoris TaxID=2838504 RepID=A0A9D2IE09_9FIRM|nr:protein jag [Candidatus Borkfalkia avistercoris]